MVKQKKVLLLVESSTAYGRKIVRGVSQYVRERKNWTLHIEDRGLYSVPTQLLQGWRGDGIIARTSGSSLRKILDQCRCPIVELLSDSSGTGLDVMPDAQRAMELCFDYYLGKKVLSVAFYGFGRNWWIQQRQERFLTIAAEKRIAAHCFVDRSRKKPEAQPLWDEQYEKPLRRWLQSLPPRTGIIAANDAQAMRVLNVCRTLDLAVPEQLALLGFDNDEHLCNLTTPTLSSLDQNAELIGYRSSELLDLKMKRKRPPPTPIVVAPKGVVERRSTEISVLDDPDVTMALRFIAENATKGIRTEDVTDHLGISRSTLCRRFQKELSRSPQDEIMRVRLDHAKHLLIDTDLTIRAVVSRSGYGSVEYFTTTFRIATGETPMRFRERHRSRFFPPSIDTDVDSDDH